MAILAQGSASKTTRRPLAPPEVPVPIKGAALPLPGQHLHYVDACECGGWHLVLWPHDDPIRTKKVSFKCRSWRHAGACRQWKGAQDFVRCREAMQKWDYWTYLTLTFENQESHSPWWFYYHGKEKWAKLRKRLVREWGKIGYIQTWERHQSGYPHVNVVVRSPALYGSAIHDPTDNWMRLLRDQARECGFGRIGWCERLHDPTACAGYLVKLARELTGAGPKNQIPVNAPRHFRRLRASQGLLPPVHKNPDIDGVLKLVPL
jgi:hypothetical protein